ncbi:MAG: response regulator transcription factor [Defluviitaleaceae bacterium]|nr:response regulator transcription factor [Defluviitaleaceae bacterium]
MKILIIEDESAIQTILKTYLEEAGYEIALADDGLDGVSKFQTGAFDLVLLDIMMPKIDGYAVLELIRKDSNVPVIMITAMDSDADQMKAFDLAVDDYITKPFNMSLVQRRIDAVLRRSQKPEDSNVDGSGQPILKHGDLSVDIVKCEVSVSDKSVSLTKKEFELLKLFLENPNRVFTREVLLETLWDYAFYGNPKVVNAHIQNLRKKLGGDYVDTVRGMGYRLSKENEN